MGIILIVLGGLGLAYLYDQDQKGKGKGKATDPGFFDPLATPDPDPGPTPGPTPSGPALPQGTISQGQVVGPLGIVHTAVAKEGFQFMGYILPLDDPNYVFVAQGVNLPLVSEETDQFAASAAGLESGG